MNCQLKPSCRGIALRPGSFGGVTRFAKANNITIKRAREVLQRDLGYTLHRPRRRRFPTLPVVVYGIDEQWTANLIEVGNSGKHCEVQSWLSLSLDCGGCIFQACMGGTLEIQDGKVDDGWYGLNIEEERWKKTH